jgi:hypothetical protein
LDKDIYLRLSLDIKYQPFFKFKNLDIQVGYHILIYFLNLDINVLNINH